MRISDWSSDVCSSDLLLRGGLDVDVFGRGDVVGGDEVVGQLGGGVFAEGHRLLVDQLAVGEQLEGEHVDLFLRLLALADHVAAVVVGEARLDAVAGVVGQRQRDRSEEHTSELQSIMRSSYAVFCWNKKNN